MKLINFSHPLTAVHLAAINDLAQPVEQVLDVRCQFDPALPFAQQARELIDRIGFLPEQWQTTPLLINPPSLNFGACVVLAELHGRMGYFPPVLRLRPVQGSVPPQFEVAEIVNLQMVRDSARNKR